MNETIKKFKYPDTLIFEYDYWVVLLRPKQITVGSLILASKSDAENLSELSSDAYLELAIVTKHIETVLFNEFKCEKINYLLLMMVDRHVHFHVLPRYSSTKELFGVSFEDSKWPKAPDITNTVNITNEQFNDFLKQIRLSWPPIE